MLCPKLYLRESNWCLIAATWYSCWIYVIAIFLCYFFNSEFPSLPATTNATFVAGFSALSSVVDSVAGINDFLATIFESINSLISAPYASQTMTLFKTRVTYLGNRFKMFAPTNWKFQLLCLQILLLLHIL